MVEVEGGNVLRYVKRGSCPGRTVRVNVPGRCPDPVCVNPLCDFPEHNLALFQVENASLSQK